MEALRNDGVCRSISIMHQDIVNGQNQYTNWPKYFWGKLGKSTDAETSVAGGDSLTTFRISGGYHYLTDPLSFSGANQRASLSFNIDHKSKDQRLDVALTGTYSYVSTNLIYDPNVITLPPDAPPVFDSKGNLNYAAWDAFGSANPLSYLLQPYSSAANTLNSNLVINYEILKGLKFRSNFGYNDIRTSQTFLIPSTSL